MINEKKWIASGKDEYTMLVNDKEAGSLSFHPLTVELKADAKIAEEVFLIRKTDFLKDGIEVSDSNGNIIAKAYSKDWFDDSSILEYDNKFYKLILRNNPMPEWSILEDDKTILTYGLLDDKGILKIKISSSFDYDDSLFDCLLWYLFVPIAHENFGNNLIY